MRIALVHSYYRSEAPSGENVVVDRQADLLRAAGHEVHVEDIRTDELRRESFYAIRTAFNVATGSGVDPVAGLRRFAPDVVHVHNLFPNFGTKWLESWPGPLVATLHNYRPLCANASLQLGDSNCTRCPDGQPLAALRHRCYSSSTVATVPLVVRNRGGLSRNPLFRRADRLIALSEVSRDIYLRYGADRNKLTMVPNGVPAAPATMPVNVLREKNRWVTIGRISAEKGTSDLISSWPEQLKLDVIGDGPDAGRLKRLAPRSVAFLGRLPPEEVLQRLRSYSAVVLPGTNYEGAHPLVAVEAMAAGLPLVAAEGGAAARLVSEYHCGVVYRNRESLVSALASSEKDRVTLGAAGRAAWAENFTTDRWLSRLLGTYRDVGA